MSQLMIGKQVLGYTVKNKIGGGATGDVYYVIKSNISGEYKRALKHIELPSAKQYRSVLNSMGGDRQKTDDYFSSILSQIVNEIKILSSLSKLDRQNIVVYYENDIVKRNNEPCYDIYILMEYLLPFQEYLQSHVFTANDAIKCALDILSALKTCHNAGIMHRDIKEENIFYDQDLQCFKLGDFGVAKEMKGKTYAESLKGTLYTIAPEVYTGKCEYTYNADLYSVGILLYRFFNYWRNPFMPQYPDTFDFDDDDKAFEKRILGTDVPQTPNNANEILGRLILKSISFDPSLRFQSAEEFYNDLDAIRRQSTESELDQVLFFHDASDDNNDNLHNERSIQPTFQNPFEHSMSSESEINVIVRDVQIMDSEKQRNTSESIHQNKTITGAASDYYDEDESDSNSNLFSDPEEETSSEPVAKLFSQADNVKANNMPITNIPIATNTDNREGSDANNIKRYFLYSIPAVSGLIVIYATIKMVKELFGSLSSYYNIVLAGMLLAVFGSVFVISLFFIGKNLNKKTEVKYICLMSGQSYKKLVQVIKIRFNTAKQLYHSQTQKAITSKFNAVCEKLEVETDFGVTSEEVTNYENQIIQYLTFIESILNNLTSDNIDDEFIKIASSLDGIQLLLKERDSLIKINGR